MALGPVMPPGHLGYLGSTGCVQNCFMFARTVSTFLILQLTKAQHFLASLLPRPHSLAPRQDHFRGACAVKAPRGHAIEGAFENKGQKLEAVMELEILTSKQWIFSVYLSHGVGQDPNQNPKCLCVDQKRVLGIVMGKNSRTYQINPASPEFIKRKEHRTLLKWERGETNLAGEQRGWGIYNF